MTDPLVAHRNIDAPTQPDLTRAEAEALMAHRMLLARVKHCALGLEGFPDANDALQTGIVTGPAEIAAWLLDTAGTIERECGRIERGEYRGEGV